MSGLAIRAEGLGKRYRIVATEDRRADTLRDVVARKTARLGTRLRNPFRTEVAEDRNDLIWALRDLTFEVPEGQVLGIVGPNGAGKSTLLKVLSRITEPTEGKVALRGRVGSLLEVGTGFHAELTGRENMYLNGAILGMTRREIERKFDEMVEFAGIERFLDTPVKQYSTGMYLRLGFSVAAHLEPDILLIDEVLSVGDAEFQKKCLGKIRSVAVQGRTVVFVSHNMNSVRQLCHRCILMQDGSVSMDGSPAAVVGEYLQQTASRAAPGEWVDLSRASRGGSGEAKIESLCYSGSESLDPAEWPRARNPLLVDLRIATRASHPISSLAITIFDESGSKLLNADILSRGQTITLRPGIQTYRFLISQLNLEVGRYTLGVWLADPPGRPIDYINDAITLEVAGRSGEKLRPRGIGTVVCDFEFVELG